MSAIARYFRFTGMNVAGYDVTRTDLTNALQSEGIDIHYEDDIRFIPSNWNPAETMAVFTPALPDDHNELSWFREKPIALLKRAKVLGLICNEKSCIAVAGTHGKTTVSTMAATIMDNTGPGCGAFLGGISKNFDSNLLLPKTESPWIVAEADEFDRSFLHLQPQIALVTALDADHLDVYGDREKMIEAFGKFISQIKQGGKLLVKKGIALDTEKTDAGVYYYSLKDQADFYAVNLRRISDPPYYLFDLHTPGEVIPDCRLYYPGLLNVENAVAAAGVAFLAGASPADIKTGLEEYRGVIRRFDVRFHNEDFVYIDDYAHHPEELRAVITSVKELYPGKKVTGIFQPHLYSRTRDFAAEFAASLNLLDEVILIPIYPAREEPIPGISSEIIFDKITQPDKFLLPKEDAAKLLAERPAGVVLTLGAGDIDGIAGQIIEVLRNKKDAT